MLRQPKRGNTGSWRTRAFSAIVGRSSVAGRLLLICGALLGLTELASGEGNYQSTKDGKTLVWNGHPKPGDVAMWSGARDRDDYARGFGRLTWYTSEPGSVKPQLYARYWGRMIAGKFEGPVNVHAKRRTHYAIFLNGTRVTSWAAGTATSLANAQWRMLAAKRHANVEPESPAAGPADVQGAGSSELSENRERRTEANESIQDLWSERWPKIDVDESLRLLVYPPRSLRVR
jgi:hypothetical protein